MSITKTKVGFFDYFSDEQCDMISKALDKYDLALGGDWCCNKDGVFEIGNNQYLCSFDFTYNECGTILKYSVNSVNQKNIDSKLRLKTALTFIKYYFFSLRDYLIEKHFTENEPDYIFVYSANLRRISLCKRALKSGLKKYINNYDPISINPVTKDQITPNEFWVKRNVEIGK